MPKISGNTNTYITPGLKIISLQKRRRRINLPIFGEILRAEQFGPARGFLSLPSPVLFAEYRVSPLNPASLKSLEI